MAEQDQNPTTDGWWQQAAFAAGETHSRMAALEPTVYELGQDIPDTEIYRDARAEYEAQASEALVALREQHAQIERALDRLDALIARDRQ